VVEERGEIGREQDSLSYQGKCLPRQRRLESGSGLPTAGGQSLWRRWWRDLARETGADRQLEGVPESAAGHTEPIDGIAGKLTIEALQRHLRRLNYCIDGIAGYLMSIGD
jgi:hypothetical protein